VSEASRKKVNCCKQNWQKF